MPASKARKLARAPASPEPATASTGQPAAAAVSTVPDDDGTTYSRGASTAAPATTALTPLPVVVQQPASIGESAHGYRRAQGDTVDLSDEPRVHHLLLRRRMAKKSHEFAKADALRDELRRECGVEVFDKTMIWKVIGSLGHVPLPNGQESGRSAQSAPLPSAAVDAKKLRKKERKAAKKAAAKVAEAPISSGFGHSMLLKMGWSEGSGLREGAIAMPLKPLPASERRLKQDGDEGDAGAEASSTSKAESKAEMRSVGKRKAPCEATERNAPPDPTGGTSARQGANGAIAEGDEPVPPKKQKLGLGKQKLNGKAMARLKRRAVREAAEKRAGVQPGAVAGALCSSRLA